ncbi:MAG TPA: Flp family type IVb pilin [Stellaceae bacterium]|nr:Flp family type IVb pilin [Stellaceae bacterium]
MMWTQICAGSAQLRSDRSAATAIEYALLASIIALALISLQYTIGASIINFFTEVANGL